MLSANFFTAHFGKVVAYFCAVNSLTRNAQTASLGVAILVVANILFSTKAVIIKLMYRVGVGVFDVIALRMLFALPFYIGALWYLRRAHDYKPLTVRQLLAVGGLGVLSYYISSMLDFWGLQYVSAGIERLILYTYPTLILVFSMIFLGKKISRAQYLALAVTYAGIFLAFAAEQQLTFTGQAWLGAGLVFGCAITYALYVLLTGEYVHRIGSVRFTCYAVIGATIPALVQSVVYNRMDIFHYDARVYGYALALGVLATVIPTFLIVEGIRRVGASDAGIIGFVGPVSTILLAWMFLGESITLLQLMGTGVVLVGIALLTRRK